jgi:LysR family hydrogen peroxide-inducible transcriptional activator
MRVAEKAQRILRDAEDLTDMVRAAGKPLAGELRMGVIPTIAPFLLPTCCRGLREQWPDLKLYLREETSQAACDALHRGQLDCVLLALPYGCGDVDKADLLDDRLLIAFPPAAPTRCRTGPAVGDRRDHAAAARGRPLPQGPRAVRLQPARAARRSCDPRHLAAHLVQMVDNGLGMTLIPEMAVDGRHIGRHPRRCPPLDAEHPTRRIALVWRKGSPREKEFRLLADALKAAA